VFFDCICDCVVWLCVSLQLEDAKDRFSVKEYGISVTTMEDVFLKVASEQQMKNTTNLSRVVAETVIASRHSEESEREERRLLLAPPVFDSFAKDCTSSRIDIATGESSRSKPVSRSLSAGRILDAIVRSCCMLCGTVFSRMIVDMIA
jgi:hypothetical protein